MIKTKTVLEVKIGERTFCLECDPLSTLGELFDAVSRMQLFIVERINQSQQKTKEETKEE